LAVEPYTTQIERLPKNGRHILAQFDERAIVVYQAFRPDIGHWAVEHGHFGGNFSLLAQQGDSPVALTMGACHMEIVLFVGIPASGKSTFYRQRFFDTHIRINLDMLRTRHRETVLLEACLAAKQPFVVDNTNVTREERSRYIAPARAAGFRVVGYYFQSSIGMSIERNAGRTLARPVPVKGIAAKYYRLQIPALDEGFDQLYYVTVAPEGSFSVQEWQDGL
jgi:predicted kinase